MITGPAARAGLALDEGLAQQLVDDTGTAVGGLALLAFALYELYAARDKHARLTRVAYQAFNGVKGAIGKRAEATLGKLSSEVTAALGEVFRELVEVDQHGLATRRRASHAHFESSPPAAALVDAFTEARLLVTDSGPDGTSVFEVAHEALLQEWPRLKDWIGERADDLRLLRQVEHSAQEWSARGAMCYTYGRTNASCRYTTRSRGWTSAERRSPSRFDRSLHRRRTVCLRNWNGLESLINAELRLAIGSTR
jgi:hypothetical protein